MTVAGMIRRHKVNSYELLAKYRKMNQTSSTNAAYKIDPDIYWDTQRVLMASDTTKQGLIKTNK